MKGISGHGVGAPTHQGPGANQDVKEKGGYVCLRMRCNDRDNLAGQTVQRCRIERFWPVSLLIWLQQRWGYHVVDAEAVSFAAASAAASRARTSRLSAG